MRHVSEVKRAQRPWPVVIVRLVEGFDAAAKGYARGRIRVADRRGKP